MELTDKELQIIDGLLLVAILTKGKHHSNYNETETKALLGRIEAERDIRSNNKYKFDNI